MSQLAISKQNYGKYLIRQKSSCMKWVAQRFVMLLETALSDRGLESQVSELMP